MTYDITHLGGEGGFAKRWQYISLFSKMGDKVVGGVKNFKKWLTSFMDGPMYLIPCCIIHSCCFVFCSNYVYSTGQYNLDFVVTHDFGTKIWKAKYDHTFLKNCPIVSALDNFFPHFRLLFSYCTCRNFGSFCLKRPVYIYTIYFSHVHT